MHKQASSGRAVQCSSFRPNPSLENQKGGDLANMAMKKVLIALLAMVCLAATVSAQFDTAICGPYTEDSPLIEDVKVAVDWIRTISNAECCQTSSRQCTTLYSYNSTDLDLCGQFDTCIGCNLPAGAYYDEILAQCVSLLPSGQRVVHGYIEKAESNGDTFKYVIEPRKCMPTSYQNKIIKQIVN
ncbi:hypothetical protein MPTK1_5g21660 [Marchantia polymorpha subsp. ruderalis]|uniref:Uncharacterized protein n=1 Tax=Marchantia polymorpha subsp. ruderalis TaxID=1480154 RepID=A0AAF6BKU5_MARPO|nr:hypothetical protein Mp_5g21660 [Marchantia polymorpha subsp. ruderalis]